MLHLDAPEAECAVQTFREGLLSRVGHDLELVAREVSVELDVEARTVEATVRLASLDVAGALRDGRVDAQALSAGDKAQIAQSLRETLDTARYPEARLRARATAEVGEGFRVEGELELHGRRVPLAFTTRLERGRQIAEVTIHQPDAGIRPFRAALGGLKVKADVRVRLSVPWPPRG